jgi:purine-binding chemotaxis protein CheW
LEYLAFQVSGEAFAVSLLRVLEVSVLREVTRVPGSRPALLGVVNVRGAVVPVVDVAARLGRGHGEMPGRSLVHASAVFEGVPTTVALAVDGVDGILRFEGDGLLPPPAALAAAERDLIAGLGRTDSGLVPVLDLDALIDVTRPVLLAPTVAPAPRAGR